MKRFYYIVLLTFTFSIASSKPLVYVGSTPAHVEVRDFLGISLTDSIDFIRWELILQSNKYELFCQYGIGKPNTNGFIDEKRINFSGPLSKEDNYYYLQHNNKFMRMVEINFNLLHLLDKNKILLAGNGGFSYTLNLSAPEKSDQFNLQTTQERKIKNSVSYEGRTPCAELSELLGLENATVCQKLKWYIIFYTDSTTSSLRYLMNGTAYRKETMNKGSWKIIRGKNGRITYVLSPENTTRSIYLLKAGENVLLFTDPLGNLLVGNKDFSYTLNRSNRKHAGLPR